jgi:hypothetical protein
VKLKIILFLKTKIKNNFNVWSYAIKIWEKNIFHCLITVCYYILPWFGSQSPSCNRVGTGSIPGQSM